MWSTTGGDARGLAGATPLGENAVAQHGDGWRTDDARGGKRWIYLDLSVQSFSLALITPATDERNG